MLWILTKEESDELTLDGMNIPHGQWTLTLVLSHRIMEAFNKPQLGVSFIIDQRKWCLIVVKVLHPSRFSIRLSCGKKCTFFVAHSLGVL
jgi:hypothetical protein